MFTLWLGDHTVPAGCAPPFFYLGAAIHLALRLAGDAFGLAAAGADGALCPAPAGGSSTAASWSLSWQPAWLY